MAVRPTTIVDRRALADCPQVSGLSPTARQGPLALPRRRPHYPQSQLQARRGLVIAPKKQPPEVVQDINSMSIDELWALHQKVSATLVAKMTAEKELIEDRLSDDANDRTGLN